MNNSRRTVRANINSNDPADVSRTPVSDFAHPSHAQEAQLNRPKIYRLVLHSQQRLNVGSEPAYKARFNVGDLKAQWSLKHDNLDAGDLHWNVSLSSFVLSTTQTPKIIEVRASQGFPMQSTTWDSETEGSSTLLAHVAGSSAAALVHLGCPTTVTELPRGIIEISVLDHDLNAQSDVTADANLQWAAVITFEPVQKRQ